MNKTIKLYDQNIHMLDFEASVISCTQDEKTGQYRVILDQTSFFPEEGGQTADRGTLNGQPVLDVRIKEDIISHILAEPVPVGEKITGQVDWVQRFDFMQQHSGEHMISGLVHKYYGYDNVGFHLGSSEVTLDFNGPLSLEQLRVIEAKANEAVWKGLPVKVSFPAPEVLASLKYRSKLELTENVRIVEIPGIDICACCAPHVENTAQIGLIKITGVQSHRGGVRVNILCGSRAAADYTKKQDSVSSISVQLSAKQEQVAEAVGRLKEENAKQKERINVLQAKLLDLQMQSLPSPEHMENVLLFVESLDHIAMKNAVNALTEKYQGYCGIFAGTEKTGYHFLIGSAAKDCLALAAGLKQNFQAKGGGSTPMIQGSVAASKALIETYFSSASQ